MTVGGCSRAARGQYRVWIGVTALGLVGPCVGCLRGEAIRAHHKREHKFTKGPLQS